ncbi:hypothetical protein Daqu01_01986 [Deinococcus aquaticus]
MGARVPEPLLKTRLCVSHYTPGMNGQAERGANRAFLERRNALWSRLRSLTPEGDGVPGADFEATLTELSTLTGWDRARILAGLGLPVRQP